MNAACCNIIGQQDCDIKVTALLLLKAIKEVKKIPGIKGINEDNLVSWIKRAKWDWVTEDDVQKYIKIGDLWTGARKDQTLLE